MTVRNLLYLRGMNLCAPNSLTGGIGWRSAAAGTCIEKYINERIWPSDILSGEDDGAPTLPTE